MKTIPSWKPSKSTALSGLRSLILFLVVSAFQLLCIRAIHSDATLFSETGNRRQCKEHWFRVLSKRPCARGIGPADTQAEDQESSLLFESAESRRGLWSHDEDAQLLRAYQELGPRWPLIASRVQGRNQRQCEKRFRRLRKIQLEESDLLSVRSNTPPLTAAGSLSALADAAIAF